MFYRRVYFLLTLNFCCHGRNQNGAELRIPESKNGLTPVDVCTTPTITELFRNLSGKPPSIPAAPALEPLSDTELKILWHDASCFLYDANITNKLSGYKIKLSSPSAPAKLVLAVAFPTETSISGLCSETEYSASICAINLHGLTKPVAPVLCITDTGPTEITVTWTLADDDHRPGVSCIIYLTSPEPDGTCNWETVFRTDDHTIKYVMYARHLSTTIENLLRDHRYKLRAAVISDDGQQTLSDAIAVRTAGKAAAKRSASSEVLGAVNVMRALGTCKQTICIRVRCQPTFVVTVGASRKEATGKQESKA
ncbi:hypothetical protein JG687_00015435 [Phytophthora cactorum]|uniref:Fibronectin type-III domain-containing protein n=1 Tax=Phytophthora cactorum TaxID=29920 RepID=A0A8T1TW93_9STRA|nr:hypothetical protein JG687_00015435 [Phytophthora cactorum]